MKRLMIAGTGSGCGKTTVACALMARLTLDGYKTQAFKCGPDYIDPMFHTFITGRQSGNLDPFMLPPSTLRYLMRKNATTADVSIVEGVMGYYDGLGAGTAFSSYEVSQITETPVVLVVNARGMSASLAATVRGFQSFRPDNRISGIILNGVAERMYGLLKPMLEQETALPVLGYLPRIEDCSLESRHLGLQTAMETDDLPEKISRLAQAAERTFDIEQLLKIATSAPPLPGDAAPFEGVAIPPGQPYRLGIAYDAAFCFYYADALKLLEETGAELVWFSPLADAALPTRLDGLYLGGGYPEIHAARLSANRSLLNEIREAVSGGMPTFAECGGFMALCRAIRTNKGSFEMAGVLDAEAFMTDRLVRFGYVDMTALADGLLTPKGWKGRGHEFHYSDSNDNGSAFAVTKPDGRSWNAIHVNVPGRLKRTLHAGYPHLHLCSDPQMALSLAAACLAYRKERERR